MQRRTASLDRFAAISKDADTRLAGIGLLVRGRHALYVSALAALLASRGARVWESHDGTPPRVPRGATIAILESPVPSELHALARRGMAVIVLADRAEAADALAAAQLGAHALLPKNCTLGELSIAIRSASVAGQMPHRPSLTPRQHEVLELIVEGLDNTQIASRLGITERTVRAHVSSVLERTGTVNRTQAAVAAIQRGWVATLLLTLVFVGCLAATAVAAVETPAKLRAALSREMRSAGGASGAWVYDGGSASTVFKWQAAQRRVPASVQKLVTTATALDRLGPEARFETAVLADGAVAEGTLDGDLYLHGGGDPTFGTSALNRLAGRVSDTGLELVRGRVWGDETFFDRRRGGPASGFGTSPYVGPLSALGFNHGSLLPFGHGWQINPAAFAAERLRVSLRREDVSVAGTVRAGDAPEDAQTVAAVESPATRKHRAPHEPGIGQLLRRDAAQGRRRAVGRRGFDRRGRSRRARICPRGKVQRKGRGRLGALTRKPGGAARRRPAAASCAHAALVRGVLPLASPRGKDRNAPQAHAWNARLGALPGEDGHAVRRHRPRGLLQGARR